MGRDGYATTSVYAKVLRGEGAFKLRYPTSGTHGKHVEFDWSRQVLVLADHGKPYRVYHVSSGKPSTPTVFGSYHFYRQEPGTNSHGMVYSSYFIGGYAIHGYASVPNYAGEPRLPAGADPERGVDLQLDRRRRPDLHVPLGRVRTRVGTRRPRPWRTGPPRFPLGYAGPPGRRGFGSGVLAGRRPSAPAATSEPVSPDVSAVLAAAAPSHRDRGRRRRVGRARPRRPRERPRSEPGPAPPERRLEPGREPPGRLTGAGATGRPGPERRRSPEPEPSAGAGAGPWPAPPWCRSRRGAACRGGRRRADRCAGVRSRRSVAGVGRSRRRGSPAAAGSLVAAGVGRRSPRRLPRPALAVSSAASPGALPLPVAGGSVVRSTGLASERPLRSPSLALARRGRARSPGHRGAAQVLGRVARHAAHSGLEVEVRAGAVAGAAHVADHLTLLHVRARRDAEARQVRVTRRELARVRDADDVPVAALLAGEAHAFRTRPRAPACRSRPRCPCRRGFGRRAARRATSPGRSRAG